MLTPNIPDLAQMLSKLRGDVDTLKRRANGRGATGPVGPPGATGPQGPAGPAGSSVAQYAKYWYNNASGLTLATGSWTQFTSWSLQDGDSSGIGGSSGNFTLPAGKWRVTYNMMGGSSVAGATLFAGLAFGLSSVTAANQMVTGFTATRASGPMGGSFTFPFTTNDLSVQVWYIASATTVLYHHYLSFEKFA